MRAASYVLGQDVSRWLLLLWELSVDLGVENPPWVGDGPQRARPHTFTRLRHRRGPQPGAAGLGFSPCSRSGLLIGSSAVLD